MAKATEESATPSGEMIIIGCKLAHGLRLELIEVDRDNRGSRPRAVGKPYFLRGANALHTTGQPSKLHLPFATTSVPKDFWLKWKEANRDLEFMKNGQIFEVSASGSLSEREASVAAAAKERAKTPTGFEPLDGSRSRGEIETDARVLETIRKQERLVEQP
jgi:hypothetical protein